MSKEQNDRLISPVVRVWFPPHLHTVRPSKNPAIPGKYGLTVVVTPETMDSQDKALWDAMVRAANGKAIERFKKPIKDFTDAMKKPWHSGREKKDYGMTDKDVYMNCTSKFQPIIAGPDAKTIKDPLPDYIYPGCYVRISTAPYTYDQDGGRGVAFGVFNVMFVRDGERLAFRVEPEDDFSDYATAGTTATGGAALTDSDLGL